MKKKVTVKIGMLLAGLILSSCETLLVCAAVGLAAASYIPFTSTNYYTPTYTPMYTSTYVPSGSYYNDSSSSSSSSSSTTSYKCVYCNGTGQILKEGSVPSFGQTTTSVCSVCGGKLFAGEYHSHQTCTHCKGTGRVTYN